MTSTDHDDEIVVTFTRRQWLEVRRTLSKMRYSGSVHPSAMSDRFDGDDLTRWLTSLNEQLIFASGRADRNEEKLREATKVIDAGRLVFAAFAGPTVAQVVASFGGPYVQADNRPDVGDAKSLHEAILLAVADAGPDGAAVEDIETWIEDNRSGGPVPRQALTARIDELTQAGKLVESNGPTWRTWAIPSTRPAPAGTVLLRGLHRAVFDCLTDTEAWHATTPRLGIGSIHGWINARVAQYPTIDGPAVTAGQVLNALDGLVAVGVVAVEGLPREQRFSLATPVDDCPECATNGTNCLAHRADAVGTAARSKA